MDHVNFVIKTNGTLNNLSQYIAETSDGKLIATISPRYSKFIGKYSSRFLNVSFMDGSVEIADSEEGEFSTEHAAEVIRKKLGL